jgi:hypothetical protein
VTITGVAGLQGLAMTLAGVAAEQAAATTVIGGSGLLGTLAVLLIVPLWSDRRRPVADPSA